MDYAGTSRLYAGKISETGNVDLDLLLTSISLSQQSFPLQTIRNVSNSSKITRYNLLPFYVNKLTKYKTTEVIYKYGVSGFANTRVKGNLLFRAIDKKDIRHLRELLDAGANCNKNIKYSQDSTELDYSLMFEYIPLYYAIQKQFVEGVRVLLNYMGEIRINNFYYREMFVNRVIANKRFNIDIDQFILFLLEENKKRCFNCIKAGIPIDKHKLIDDSIMEIARLCFLR